MQGQKAKYCSRHKTSDMLNVSMPLCLEPGCKSRPFYDVEGGKGVYCGKHKLIGMIDINCDRCTTAGCSERARYNVEGTKRGIACSAHKTDTMTDVVSPRCKAPGCKQLQPAYNVEGCKTGKYCTEHKEEGMVNVTAKRCKHPGCNTLYPSFAMRGERTGQYCSEHKTDEMVNVRAKCCEFPGCPSTNRAYAKVGEVVGRYCAKHREAGMVDVKNEKKGCRHEGCRKKSAIYDGPGGIGQFCKTHKKEGMVNVKSKRCEHEGCDKKTCAYDVPGGKGRFCKVHKQPGMIDVRSTRCDAEGCMKICTYGRPGLVVSRCFAHREKGMIRRSNARCKVCKEPAVWGKHWMPTHCDAHKEEGEENFVERPCVKCGLEYILDANGTCEHCNPEVFQRARLAKQRALMDALDAAGFKGTSTDVMIDGGDCGRERPDRTFDFGDKIVVVECDEHQHRDRACQCEQTRMVNIGQSYGGVPVYFIRWNPDDYASEKKPESLSNRYKELIAYLKGIQRRVYLKENTSLVSVMYMYYDGWCGDCEWTKVL